MNKPEERTDRDMIRAAVMHEEKIDRHIEAAKEWGERLPRNEEAIDLMGWRPTAYVLALEVERLRGILSVQKPADSERNVCVDFSMKEFRDTIRQDYSESELNKLLHEWVDHPNSLDSQTIRKRFATWADEQLTAAVKQNHGAYLIVARSSIIQALRPRLLRTCERTAYHFGYAGYHEATGLPVILGPGPKTGVLLLR